MWDQKCKGARTISPSPLSMGWHAIQQPSFPASMLFWQTVKLKCFHATIASHGFWEKWPHNAICWKALDGPFCSVVAGIISNNCRGMRGVFPDNPAEETGPWWFVQIMRTLLTSQTGLKMPSLSQGMSHFEAHLWLIQLVHSTNATKVWREALKCNRSLQICPMII